MPTARRRATLALLAVLALLVLTGCLRAQQHLTLNSDATVDGTITVAVSQELLELSGSTAEDVLTQITEGESPVPEGVEVEESDYDQDGFVGKTFTFTGASLDQINDQGDLTITHEGDTFVVDGEVDMTAGPEEIDLDDPTTQGLLEEFEVSMSVTFPGEVTEHDGTLDGTTVTWVPAFGENTSIHAVGSAIGDGGSSSVMTWVLIGLAILLIVVVVVIIVMRGRGSRGDEEAATADAGAAPVEAGDAATMPTPPPAPDDGSSGSG